MTSCDMLMETEGNRDQESGDKELAAAVKFVEKHRYQTLPVLDLIVSRSGEPERAIASFSTVHRAKELEWDYVNILDDFIKLGSEMDRNENGELQLPDEQELNLLYVAVTIRQHDTRNCAPGHFQTHLLSLAVDRARRHL